MRTLVAIDQYYPKNQHILADDLAYCMLPFSTRALVRLMQANWMRSWMINASEKDSPGIWGGMMCRNG